MTESPWPPTRPPRRRAERTAELLEAALRVIDRDGAAASMERIAAEAGITRPVLYRHFGDAGGLYQAVADRFADDLFERSRAAVTGVPGGRQLVRAQVDGYLGFLESEPNLYRFLTRHPVDRADAREVVSGFVQQLGGMIGEFLESTGVEPGVAGAMGRAFVGAIHVASEWWLEQPTLSRSELAETLTAFLWDGMRVAVASSGAVGAR